jgi:hypothetical protein
MWVSGEQEGGGEGEGVFIGNHLEEAGMTFTPGQRVKTPKGRGVVVARFPARKVPQRESYTVRLGPKHGPCAAVFYARELRAG